MSALGSEAAKALRPVANGIVLNGMACKSSAPLVKILIVRGQQAHHDSANIVGNREGLKALRDLIDVVLENEYASHGISEQDFVPPDGEHYDVGIRLNDADWRDESWKLEAHWYDF